MRFITGLALALVCSGCGPHLDPRVEQLAADYDKNEKAFKAAGFLTTVEDLGLPPVAPDDDATPLLDQATKVGQAYDKTAVTKLLNKGQGKEALALLSKAEERFKLFEQASHKEGASLHRDDMSPLPMASEFVFSGVCLKAEALAMTKDYAGMREMLMSADRVLALLSPDPKVPTGLGPFTCKGVFLHALADCAVHVPRAELDGIEKLALRQRDRMTYGAMVTDAVLGLSVTMKEGLDATLKEKLPSATQKELITKSRALMSQFYAAMTKLAPNIPLVLTDKKVVANWSSLILATTPYPYLRFNFNAAGETNTGTTMTAKDLVPDAPMYAQVAHGSDAVLKSTVGLIEVLKFKAAKGAWPKTLSQIPGDWTDPFGHGTLKMMINRDRIRIYSLGTDAVDVGGYEPGQKVKNPGISVELGRSP